MPPCSAASASWASRCLAANRPCRWQDHPCLGAADDGHSMAQRSPPAFRAAQGRAPKQERGELKLASLALPKPETLKEKSPEQGKELPPQPATLSPSLPPKSSSFPFPRAVNRCRRGVARHSRYRGGWHHHARRRGPHPHLQRRSRSHLRLPHRRCRGKSPSSSFWRPTAARRCATISRHFRARSRIGLQRRARGDGQGPPGRNGAPVPDDRPVAGAALAGRLLRRGARHHPVEEDRGRTARGQGARRGDEPPEIRVSRQRQPRAQNAAQRHHGLLGSHAAWPLRRDRQREVPWLRAGHLCQWLASPVAHQ